MADDRTTVLNPRGTPPDMELIPMAPRLDTLDGKTIYVVDVNFPMTEPFYVAAEKLLKERFPKTNWVIKAKVGSFFDKHPEFWEEIRDNADAAIVGPGHLDTLGPAVVGWCADLEKLGVPAVPLICAVLPALERQIAYERGVPDMRLTFIPYEVVGTDEATCRKVLGGNDPVTGKPVLDEFVDVLTRQPTDQEKKTGVIKRENPRLLPPDTEENLHRMFLENSWTDYYPIVLPTEERVAAMLKGTSHKPDEYVGTMFPSAPQEAWSYNVEQVAVNAVMAGARPEHFPTILAIASTGATSLWSSVTSQNRMVVVNGPARLEMKMNGDIGAMGPFNEANAVVGRAWTFISKNLGGGGGEAGITYLGAFGNGLNYNNLCMPENEEGLPEGWLPIHVQKGYKKEESTVSLYAGFGVIMDGNVKPTPHHMAILDQFEGLKHFSMNVFYRGVEFGMRAVLFITPIGAQMIQDEGFKTKEELTKWLSQNLYKPGDKEQLRRDAEIDVIVVGGCIQGYMPGNMHYNLTASIDKWR